MPLADGICMKLELVKFRDILTNRINKFGGRNDSCVKAGKINILLDEEEYLIIDSVTGGNLLSEIFINCHRRKGGKK